MPVPIELKTWALRHHVSEEALRELSHILGAPAQPMNVGPGSESRVQSLVRLEAPGAGFRLFRNNVGVLKNEQGTPVRYGLANDSKALNRQLKSGDLIGWRRLTIEPQHVGLVVAQFASVECKHEGWTYRGDEHEVAQQRWAALVAADGGFARFASGAGALA